VLRTASPEWPDDPETVEEANANPDVFAHKTVGLVKRFVKPAKGSEAKGRG